jgi:ABC-type phosphate transport system substrate-binding protein
MSKKISKISIALGALLLFPLTSVAELVVIANPNLPVTSLSREQISRIYLGKMKFLANGAKVIPLDQSPGSPTRTVFYADVMQKSEVEMRSYWSRIIFTGQGTQPVQEGDDKSVKDAVASHPSYLGYVDKSAVDGSVKVVFSQ